MKRVFRHPSPAMVIAIIALFAALGGSAIAGKALNAKKVKKISRRIADQEITAKAPGLSVKHASTADSANSLTGQTKINYSGDSGAADQQVFSSGGLTLTAQCSGTAATLVATTSVPATLQSYGNGGDTNNTAFTTTANLVNSDEERDFVYTTNSAVIVGQIAAGFRAGGIYGSTAPNCIIKGYVQVL